MDTNELEIEVLTDKGIYSPILEELYSKKDILPYSCDFLLHHKNSNYYFNIEIDESYVFDTKAPIHYVTKNEENEIVKFSENNRDYELSEYCGWIIYRFAEIQIVKHPQTCIDLIIYLIKIFLQDEGIGDPQKAIIPKGFYINRWTFEEGIEYSKSDFRKSYLNGITTDSHNF